MSTSSSSFDFDAIVIGGGPAGATAALVMAREGLRVKVLKRTLFPRFHSLRWRLRLLEWLVRLNKIVPLGVRRKRFSLLAEASTAMVETAGELSADAR